DVLFDDDQAERALDAVRESAKVTGLELAVCASNLREHTEEFVGWNPVHGAFLSGLANALRPSRALVGSGYAFGELTASGSHQQLDHRFSSEVTRIEVHGEATRVDKAARVAEWPDAIERIRVGLDGNFMGNCCDCSKCLHTMIELRMAGVDPRRAGFARPLTPARAASVQLRDDGLRIHRVVLNRMRARGEPTELADAFELAIRRLETRQVAESLAE